MPSLNHFRTQINLFDELAGERVLVRPYRVEDAEALREAVEESREHIRAWLPFADAHQTIEETRDWITHRVADWLLREDLGTGVFLREDGAYLGGLGLHPRSWEIGFFEIGYWLRASAEGHGYMREAVSLLVEFAARDLLASRLEIRCDARNARSAGVAERLGFKREGHIRNGLHAPTGGMRDTLIFGLIPGDPTWPA
ncbi:MAG TPA: GNAT family N-acetyltransferase [Ktedonobacterales bacterium]|jgi:ribosomal-protein-serine acetyltransferase|nr:GNAT family N-acetyltransferase [Ktedonobacterales bacterium]